MLLNCSIVNSVRKRIDDSKQIPNYSNYVILPNEGLVYSLKRNKFIGNKGKKGYWKTALTDDNGNGWNTQIHRIVYIACYGEIPDGLDVNHIDENKNDNSIFNLNLMTRSENNNWGTRKERYIKTRSKTVGAYKNGELVMTFSSTKEAGRNGYKQSAVSGCCRGIKGCKTYKGYEWQYIETEKVSI